MAGVFPYALAIIIIACMAFIRGSDIDQNKTIQLIAIVIVLTLISGLRSSVVGTDTNAYCNMYYRIANCMDFTRAMKVSTINAPVYVLYCWLLGKLGCSHQVLLFVNSLIINFGIALFIKDTSDNPPASFLCYMCLAMFFQSMNGMRQYMAIAFAINAYYGFYKHGVKSIMDWLLFFIAIGIHAISLIVFPALLIALLLRSSKNERRQLRFVILAAFTFALLLGPLSSVFLQLFPTYSIYDGRQNIALFSTAYGGRVRLLYAFLMLLCYMALRKTQFSAFGVRDTDERIIAMLPLCLFCSVLGLAYGTSFLINRMLWFFMVAYISFIPLVISKYEGGVNTLLKMGTGLALTVWFVMNLAENKDGVVPYVLGF